MEKGLRSKPESNGLYKQIVVKEQQGQTMLRACWNMLIEIDAFRHQMNDFSKLVIFVNAGRIGWKIKGWVDELFREIEYTNPAYIMMTSRPTADKLSALQFTSPFAYIRVMNDKENLLLFFDKKAKKCINLTCRFRPGDFGWRDDQKINTVYYATDEFLEKIQYMFTHTPPSYLGEDVYPALMGAKSFLKWVLDRDGCYEPEKIQPMINKFCAALPLKKLFSILKLFLEKGIIPDDCKFGDYTDSKSDKEFSLNGHLLLADRMVQERINICRPLKPQKNHVGLFKKKEGQRERKAHDDIHYDRLRPAYL